MIFSVAHHELGLLAFVSDPRLRCSACALLMFVLMDLEEDDHGEQQDSWHRRSGNQADVEG